MPVQQFDIIVIGAGSGGLNIAGFMNRVGFKVLLIDKSDAHIGGDCLNFGCVPSKALIHVAREVHTARAAGRFGLSVSGEVDWRTVREYVKSKQDIIRAHESVAWFREKGITVVLGEACFTGSNTVQVNDMQYTAKRIVLATGSRPRLLTGQGIERVARVLNNETIFSMETLPQRLLVLGAGPIGIELAEALAMLGTKVVVADRGSQILGKEDPALAGVVASQMEKLGVVFKMGYSLQEFTDGETATLVSTDGATTTEKFDAVFVGIGRVLNTEGLALDKAQIAVDATGKIKVDPYLRTTNKSVYVCGDIAGNYQFTHAAEMHAAVILRNFFSPLKQKFNADTIAWTTFTTPELATYGLQEATLKHRGIPYRVLETDFSEDDRAITDAYQYGRAKMFVSPKGAILGGTMVAPNAGELVQELILAQSAKLSIASLFAKVYPYPTATRINKRMAALFSAEKLTPFSKRLLRLIY